MSLRRDVGERSVTIVPQEVIVGRFARCLRLARRTVDQENVLITVVVIIQKACALPVHLLQVLAHFVPADDLHVQTGSLSDIRESRQGEARAIEGLVRRLDWGPNPRGDYHHGRKHAAQRNPKRLGRSALHEVIPVASGFYASRSLYGILDTEFSVTLIAKVNLSCLARRDTLRCLRLCS